MTAKPSKPDYLFWSKLDYWSFKDAALLLHDVDPLECKPVRFNTREVPTVPEFKEAYKTFLILKDANVKQQRPYSDNTVPPSFILTVAAHKDLPIPDALIAMLQKRLQREPEVVQDTSVKTSITTSSIAIAHAPDDKALSTRERRSLLKAIGIMAILLAEDPKRSDQFKLNHHPNAFQIAQAALDKASALGIEAEGIKSLNRKIKEALALLADEYL